MTRPLPDLPASHWHSHPAWPTQAYPALVGFHDRYRRETRRLIAAAQDDAVSPDDVGRDCARLRERLHNHEAVEEQLLYPWIEQQYAVDLASQRQQHASLNAQLDRVVQLVGGATRPALTGLLAELVELDRILCQHLDGEEAICVPALLDMSAETFAAAVGD